ncbi:MAG: hypothetical protein RR921_02490 [Mucinivorans sp.]
MTDRASQCRKFSSAKCDKKRAAGSAGGAAAGAKHEKSKAIGGGLIPKYGV